MEDLIVVNLHKILQREKLTKKKNQKNTESKIAPTYITARLKKTVVIC